MDKQTRDGSVLGGVKRAIILKSGSLITEEDCSGRDPLYIKKMYMYLGQCKPKS